MLENIQMNGKNDSAFIFFLLSREIEFRAILDLEKLSIEFSQRTGTFTAFIMVRKHMFCDFSCLQQIYITGFRKLRIPRHSTIYRFRSSRETHSGKQFWWVLTRIFNFIFVYFQMRQVFISICLFFVYFNKQKILFKKKAYSFYLIQ